ncbi:TPA: O-antigen ligase family protein [Candidatus Micrarchaeota archaeon]|nr:O-antigen ligase family protein [Candidatus Micrarchaeota archaeon]
MDVRRKHNSVTFVFVLVALVFMYGRPYEILPALEKIQITKVALFSALIFSLLEGNKGSILKEKGFRLFALLELLTAALIPFSIWPANSMDFWLNSYLKVFAVFYLILLVAADYRKFNITVIVILICSSIMAARTVAAFYDGQIIFDHDGTRRVTGISMLSSNNPNDIAVAFAMAVPLALYFYNVSKGVISKSFYAGVAAVNLLAILFTGSRGGYLGVLFGLFIFFILKYKKRKMKFAIISVLVMAIVLPLLPSDYKARFMSSFDTNDYSYSDEKMGRIAIWKRGLASIAKEPLGSGIKNYTITEGERKREQGFTGKWLVAHNSYLQIAVELGVLGLVLYMMFLWEGFRSLKKIIVLSELPPGNNRTRLCAYAFAGSMAAFVVSSLFLSQAYYWNQYIYIALIISLKNIMTGAAGPAPTLKMK